MLKNPGYVVLGLGHAKGVCVTRHLTPCWIMVAGHIRLGRQDLPQHTNCTFSTRPDHRDPGPTRILWFIISLSYSRKRVSMLKIDSRFHGNDTGEACFINGRTAKGFFPTKTLAPGHGNDNWYVMSLPISS